MSFWRNAALASQPTPGEDSSMANERRPTTVMAGGGEYDRNAKVQSEAASLAIRLLRRAASEAALPSGDGPIVAVDYGSATGRNSLAPLNVAIETLRMRDPRPILVIHEDQPDNDYRSLFDTIYNAPESYTRQHQGVFGCAIGRSFYDPVAPPASVCLGWSSAAAHWLSGAPPRPSDHLWAPTVRFATGPAVREAARRDWHQFLSRRADELRSGGRMVVLLATVDDEGVAGGEHVLDGLNRVLQRQVASGAICGHEYENLVVPMFFRSREDLEAPFAGSDLGDRLTLLEHCRGIVPDPLWNAFVASGEVNAFAASFTAWVRAFTAPCLLASLDAQRSPEDRRAVADAIYGELETDVQNAPAEVRCAWRIATLLIGKQ
jgi:hypothetical protein